VQLRTPAVRRSSGRLAPNRLKLRGLDKPHPRRRLGQLANLRHAAEPVVFQQRATK
jgi:hypothetical protein